jgi:HAMP domain-containing protein
VKFLSLRWKISGILVFSNLILGLIIVIIVNRTVSENLSRELIERGRTIALNLAQYSAEQILEEDVVGLRQLITGSLSFESVEYILIETSEDSVLVDTYNGDIPPELLEQSKEDLDLEKPPELVYISSAEIECFDIWEPVEEGYLGYIRIGMKKDYIDQSIYQTNLILISAIFGITLLGIVVVLFLANRIIKPILYLTARADDISKGELEEKVSVSTNDEIDSLAQALERLRESVKIALDRLKKQQTLRM